jgi:hypothetical protein
MTAGRLGSTAALLVLALASASAGASGARPPVALTASPSQVELAGSGRASVRVTNTGAAPVVLDVSQAGFALDLRGRPKVVARNTARSAAAWLTFRPSKLSLRPGASGVVAIRSRVPVRVEPGDHDALALFTTRRRAAGGLAVRVRMGVVVVVHAPGEIVRRVTASRLRVAGRGRVRTLELGLANRGNVTESFSRARAVLSVERDGRRLARLHAVPRELRPRTRGVLEFRYRGTLAGAFVVRADVTSDAGQVVRRTYRLRM